MADATISSTSHIPYITTSSTEKGMSVTIETKNLFIKSVEKEDAQAYKKLFGDTKVMEKYERGEEKSSEWVEKRLQIWTDRWKNKDPFSALAVFKKDTNEFIGHIIIGHGFRPGESELGFAFVAEEWNKGYGTEAVSAILQHYALELVKNNSVVGGKVFNTVHATIRTDCEAGNKILEKFMEIIGKQQKYGAERTEYSLTLRKVTDKTKDDTTAMENSQQSKCDLSFNSFYSLATYARI